MRTDEKKLKYATGFELYSRWVPLKINKKKPWASIRSFIIIYGTSPDIESPGGLPRLPVVLTAVYKGVQATR